MSNVHPLNGTGYRAPPQNIEAERALCSAILMNNRAFDKVGDFLLAEHFADPFCKVVFDTLSKLIGKGVQASAVTLKTYLEANDVFRQAGGFPALVSLAANVVNFVSVHDYGRAIYDCYLRRELVGIGSEIVNRALEPAADVEAKDDIETAENELFNLASSGAVEGGPRPFHLAAAEAIDLAERAMRHKGAVVGVTTGLVDLDQQLGGLHPSDLVILAARPGMGKTALATHMMTAAARVPEAKPVLFFSLEMSAPQLAQRVLSQVTHIDSHAIRLGKLKTDDFVTLAHNLTTLQDLPLFVDDAAALTMSAIRTRTRRMARKFGGLALIGIDYLQLIESPYSRNREQNRVQELSAVTRGLKALAKEFACPVLALSQLSRAVENREEKRPRLADLRDSGTIEQDADVVMFIYREEYYEKEACAPELLNVAEIDVAKQRHGPTGVVKVYFDGAHTAFADLAHG